jgi:hypothetical protein
MREDKYIQCFIGIVKETNCSDDLSLDGSVILSGSYRSKVGGHRPYSCDPKTGTSDGFLQIL